MTDIVQTLKRRLLTMQTDGTSAERQARFIADAVACNKRFAGRIKKMANSVVPGLELPASMTSAKKKVCQEVCPDKLKKQLDELRGTMDFWNMAVSITAARRRQLLTADEMKRTNQIIYSSLLSGDVCNLLGLSVSELNKLDAIGQLPHRYTKRIEIGGRQVFARCWLLHEVATFKDARVNISK
ncbi:hypothetical protein [Rheinheimera sp.]|uniref:hypothetical protein n=1 Tax=Rheinheimera sp. TaxID=1869214 RepID=UPI004047287E